MGFPGKMVQAVRRRRFFSRGPGNFYTGVYQTREEARKAIPPQQTEGFDNETAAGFYRERLEKVFPADYPALFWLQPLIKESACVFDFGGHVGLHFYSWRKMLNLPAPARWIVAEVPAVCAAGAAIAKERGTSDQISFTDKGAAACDGADVFFSAGALQYLEPETLPAALAPLSRPPGHIILNKIPVVDGAGYFSVQDTGVFKSAYTIFSRPRLVESLKALRYELVDSWTNPGLHCTITDSPKHSVAEYSGCYFRRA